MAESVVACTVLNQLTELGRPESYSIGRCLASGLGSVTVSFESCTSADGDSYGYAILKRVRELSGGHLQWTDGMLYPVLHRLERLGYVSARWGTSETGRRRKYYRINRQGRAHLTAQQKQWRVVDATLRGIWMEASLT